MAFRPSNHSSSNVRGTLPPPPMMMFNPTQFMQPASPQLPLPSQSVVPSQTTNTPADSYYNQGNVYNQPSAGGSLIDHQNDANLQTSSHSEHLPDSTSNMYQHAGVYYDHHAFGQTQQPVYSQQTWGYGGESISNSTNQHPSQSSEPHLHSVAESYSLNQHQLYNAYNPQSNSNTTMSQEYNAYQNHVNANVPLASENHHSANKQEVEYAAYSDESSSIRDSSLAPSSNINTDITNQKQFIAAPFRSQDVSREASLPHEKVENQNLFNSGNFQTIPNLPHDQQLETQPKPFPQQQMLASEENCNYGEQKKCDESNSDTINSAHPPTEWQIGNENSSASSMVKGTAHAQPDIVSATSSNAIAPSINYVPPTSEGNVGFNIPDPGWQEARLGQSAEYLGAHGGVSRFHHEIQGDQPQLVSNREDSELQKAPESLPPLHEAYSAAAQPVATFTSRGGYGLGPDVITAVSSSNINNASQITSDSNQHQDKRDRLQETTQNTVVMALPEMAAAEEPLWESSVIEEETKQMSSKMASRIEEMRKAKEASQSIGHQSVYERFDASTTSGRNCSQQFPENSSMNSKLLSSPETSQDTSPVHNNLQEPHGGVQLGSHNEHYAYYEQFENMRTERDTQLGTLHGTIQPSTVYNRTPDVIAEQQSLQIPAAPPSSDRNLYMKTGELNEQDDVLSQQIPVYTREPDHRTHPLSHQPSLNQATLHRPVTVPDGGNELPTIVSNTFGSSNNEKDVIHSEQDIDVPLDRLVLGESEASNQQSVSIQSAPPPFYKPIPDDSNINRIMWNNVEDNRFVAGEDDRRIPGAASINDAGNSVPLPLVPIQQTQPGSSLPPVRYRI